ncbi:MAG: SGNH/GDSL hydrolase family protein [Bacteroidia bacterium]|nr:SGNH/GDSL hydrolase family protein [Bacteroidia bacterium]
MRKLLLYLILGFFASPAIGQTGNNPCLDRFPLHVVVLGSSTAAGSGPSHPDSTWVNRYRRTLKSINPKHEVSNLARGGYNTYRLMPTGFIPPAGFPEPDTSRNISMALSLNPDAIIINLPSNDAAINVSAAAQMQNFRIMVDSARRQGVPVWVCTTQPRVFSTSKVSVQLAVRDSIFAVFGSRAIDFWSGLADSIGHPLGTYDSGDGVHLNDAGHKILFERVQAANVLDSAFAIRYQTDKPIHTLLNLSVESSCGGSSVPITLSRINIGAEDSARAVLKVKAIPLSGGMTVSFSDSLGMLSSCEIDTSNIFIEIPSGGLWEVLAIIEQGGNKDSLSKKIRMAYEAVPLPFDESICIGEEANLYVLPNGQNKLSWFINSHDTMPFHHGDSLNLTNLLTDTTFWVSSTGEEELWFDSLQTVDMYDRSWNGIMVDLIPEVDLIMDTLFLATSQIGQQSIYLYTCQGGHQGKEQDPQSWQFWDSITVNVPTTSSWYPFPLDSFTVNAGDSLGLYIHFADPTHRMPYQALSQARSFSNSDLTLVSGTGISFTFGQTFYPRMINAGIAYHQRIGPCESDRLAIDVDVTDPAFSLGVDTAMNVGDTLLLSGPPADHYLWSTGDSSQQIEVFSPSMSGDSLEVWLQINTGPSCTFKDSIKVEFLRTTSVSKALDEFSFKFDPQNRMFWLEGMPARKESLVLIDVMGRELFRWGWKKETQPYSIPDISPGVYWIHPINVAIRLFH